MRIKLWNETLPRTILLSIAISAVLAAAFCALGAELVLRGLIDPSRMHLCAVCIAALCAFLAAYLTAKHAPEKKLPATMLSAGGFAALCLLFRLLFWNETEHAYASQLICMLCAALSAAAVGSGKKKRTRHRRR